MQRGVSAAIAAAVLFGISTPLAKMLVGAVAPVMLAGVLYAGSGIGLGLILAGRDQFASRDARVLPRGRDWFWLAGATLFGGVAGPIALMIGLASSAASTASLLLNLEAVFTAALAWFMFRENFDRRVMLGMAVIVAAGLLLVWHPGDAERASGGLIFIVTACLCWAIDNNLTRKISASDALFIACFKGLSAGIVNLVLAMLVGATPPPLKLLGAAATLGFLGYGISLVLFVVALRHLGAARTGAYFAVAPFFGAAVAVLLQMDALTRQLVAAGLLMAVGVWLHLTEHHAHEHIHDPVTHEHDHVHDEHHRHYHPDAILAREPHTHVHQHRPLRHSHPHYPDIDHQHRH